jgi:hypothetical protein
VELGNYIQTAMKSILKNPIYEVLSEKKPIIHNELIANYLKSKEDKYKVNISIESDFIL